MSDHLTPYEVQEEFARARKIAIEIRDEVLAIPKTLADRLTPVELAYLSEVFEAHAGAIFDKFASDLAAAEKQLIHPTESEQ